MTTDTTGWQLLLDFTICHLYFRPTIWYREQFVELASKWRKELHRLSNGAWEETFTFCHVNYASDQDDIYLMALPYEAGWLLATQERPAGLSGHAPHLS